MYIPGKYKSLRHSGCYPYVTALLRVSKNFMKYKKVPATGTNSHPCSSVPFGVGRRGRGSAVVRNSKSL